MYEVVEAYYVCIYTKLPSETPLFRLFKMCDPSTTEIIRNLSKEAQAPHFSISQRHQRWTGRNNYGSMEIELDSLSYQANRLFPKETLCESRDEANFNKQAYDGFSCGEFDQWAVKSWLTIEAWEKTTSMKRHQAEN